MKKKTTKTTNAQDKDGLPLVKPTTFGHQLHAGRKPVLSDYAKKHGLRSFWHTDSNGKYWTGTLTYWTPRQLKALCESTLKDLKRNHPQIF